MGAKPGVSNSLLPWSSGETEKDKEKNGKNYHEIFYAT